MRRGRSVRGRITGPELEDLAYQSAANALLAVTVKLGPFRAGGGTIPPRPSRGSRTAT